MMKRLIMFMASKLAKKDCLINPEINIYVDTDGFNFAPDDRVRGLIVFGEHYPLNGVDCSIKDHKKVMKAIQSVEPFGIIMEGTSPGTSDLYFKKR